MSHSLSKIWVHIIFSTKKRESFLKDSALRAQIYDYLARVCLARKCNVDIIGGVSDHVHMLIQLNKNISLAELVEDVKKSSSKWIKTLDQTTYRLERFYWQRGYAAFSVSQSQLDAVKKYIQNQEQHHAKKNFQDELKHFLDLHKIVYDEKYLWE